MDTIAAAISPGGGGAQDAFARSMFIAVMVAASAWPFWVRLWPACQVFTAASVFGPYMPSCVVPTTAWILLTCALSSALVSGPAVPSAVRQRSDWNAFTAASVPDPFTPLTSSNPRYAIPARSHCTCWVLALAAACPVPVPRVAAVTPVATTAPRSATPQRLFFASFTDFPSSSTLDSSDVVLTGVSRRRANWGAPSRSSGSAGG